MFYDFRSGGQPMNIRVPQFKMTTRFYFYGDEHSIHSGSYYFGICDSFENERHFHETKHKLNAEKKYRDSKKALSNLAATQVVGYFGPSDALNILSLGLQKSPDKVGKFWKWLKRQSERDDPIVDFARDGLIDVGFPRATVSRKAIRLHLERSNACGEVYAALDEALAEFNTTGTKRATLAPKLRFQIFRRDDYRCKICGISAVEGARLEIDHIEPVAKGGLDHIENLQTLCMKCNRGKGVCHL